MHTLREIADALQQARQDNSIRIRELTEKTGLTAVTVRRLLEARADSRLTTLMAVADELGLEVMLIPKSISASITKSEQSSPGEVQTLVGAALKRQRESK
ncbi:MAG: transcriptional regulator, family [Burkholderia sp.]|nr:transcriptional regulator, family [Burkholderia sp.]